LCGIPPPKPRRQGVARGGVVCKARVSGTSASAPGLVEGGTSPSREAGQPTSPGGTTGPSAHHRPWSVRETSYTPNPAAESRDQPRRDPGGREQTRRASPRALHRLRRTPRERQRAGRGPPVPPQVRDLHAPRRAGGVLTTLVITPTARGWSVRDDRGRLPPSIYRSIEEAEQDAREYLEQHGGGRLRVQEGSLTVYEVAVPQPPERPTRAFTPQIPRRPVSPA
jgi:hypothetical protein